MRTQKYAHQAGFLAIALLMLIVVVAVLAVLFASMMSGNTLSSGSHLGSTLALFEADSGLEFEQRRWALNLEWYRSAIDPNPIAAGAQTVGSGTFTVYGNLPATLMKSRMSAAAGTLNAYTTDRFPPSGILQVESDLTAGAEFVRYTGVSGSTFTGVTRAQTVGTATSAASAHVRKNPVYPVTILRTTLAANCTALASIQVDANSKFLGAGTLDIEGEEMAYTGTTTTGGTTTLSGITRCLDTVTATSPAGHAIGQPVTPVLISGDSASYQVETISTGTQAGNIRYARRTIQR